MNLNHTFIKKQSDTSHRILSSALSWFGLGMLIVFSLGYGFTVIPALNQIFYSIMSMPSGFIILTIASIGMMLAIVYGAWKFNLSTLIILFVAFCLIESFYIALIFATYAANYSKLLLVFGIPAFTFAIMGLLGYFQVFNFGKLWLFLLISTIGLIVFGIATYFIKSSFVTMLYAIIGYIIFSLYVGFDLWRISRMDQFYTAGLELTKEATTRFGIIFGLSLLIDFIQLVWFMARMLR